MPLRHCHAGCRNPPIESNALRRGKRKKYPGSPWSNENVKSNERYKEEWPIFSRRDLSNTRHERHDPFFAKHRQDGAPQAVRRP